MLRYRGILLPTVANPSFPGGGFFGESKAEILELAMQHVPEWVAPFVRVDRPAAPATPTARPNATPRCAALADCRRWRCRWWPSPTWAAAAPASSWCAHVADLLAYLAGLSARRAPSCCSSWCPSKARPASSTAAGRARTQGRIISITLKYFPHVMGDGRRTLRELILDDPRAGRLSHLYLRRHTARLDEVPAAGEAIRLAFAGSHSRGAIFRNGTHLVTPEMEARFDAIAQRLPEFHFGRFDIRFEDFAQVQRGPRLHDRRGQRRRRRKHPHLGPPHRLAAGLARPDAPVPLAVRDRRAPTASAASSPWAGASSCAATGARRR